MIENRFIQFSAATCVIGLATNIYGIVCASITRDVIVQNLIALYVSTTILATVMSLVTLILERKRRNYVPIETLEDNRSYYYISSRILDMRIIDPLSGGVIVMMIPIMLVRMILIVLTLGLRDDVSVYISGWIVAAAIMNLWRLPFYMITGCVEERYREAYYYLISSY